MRRQLEMGLRLATFRKKLAIQEGKKIIQSDFGMRFGGYSKRQINSYESGATEVPGRLLYLIWEQGYSIDGIFSESGLSEMRPKDDNKTQMLIDRKESGVLRDLLENLDTKERTQVIKDLHAANKKAAANKPDTKTPQPIARGKARKGTTGRR